MPRHRPVPPLAAEPAALLAAAGRALLAPGWLWWPGSLAAALVAAGCGGAPAVVSFGVRTVASTWLLAGVSLVVAEHAAGGRLSARVAWRALRGRLPALAALGLGIRLVTDALTPLGVGLVLSAGWSIAVPVAAVERLGVREALRGSWELARPSLVRVGAVRLAAVLAGLAATALAARLGAALTGPAAARVGAQALIGPLPLVVQALLYVEARTSPMRDFNVSMAEMGVGSTPSERAR